MGRAVTHLLMNIDSSIFPGAGQICFVTPAPVVPTAEGQGPRHWSWCSQTCLSGRRMEAGLEAAAGSELPCAFEQTSIGWCSEQGKTYCLGTEGICKCCYDIKSD